MRQLLSQVPLRRPTFGGLQFSVPAWQAAGAPEPRDGVVAVTASTVLLRLMSHAEPSLWVAMVIFPRSRLHTRLGYALFYIQWDTVLRSSHCCWKVDAATDQMAVYAVLSMLIVTETGRGCHAASRSMPSAVEPCKALVAPCGAPSQSMPGMWTATSHLTHRYLTVTDKLHRHSMQGLRVE